MTDSVPNIDLLDCKPSWEDYYRSRLHDFGGTGLISRKDLLARHWPGVSVKAIKALYNGNHTSGVRLPVEGFSQKWPLFWIPHVIRVEFELFGRLGGKSLG
jgi:hypothetical protein